MQNCFNTTTIYYQEVHLLFIEKKAFITDYPDELLYCKGVLNKIKAFILNKYTLFIKICLITAIYYQEVHLYY